MLVVAVALAVFWVENWRETFYGGRHHEGFFAAYRSLDLVNGVAPTIPFALTCSRDVRVWTRLQHILKTVDMHPLRETFGAVPLGENWGPMLHRGIEYEQIERRHRELLASGGNVPGAEITDKALEEMRRCILDPGWERNKVDGMSFKEGSELFALPYVVFIQETCRQIENLLVFLAVGFVLTLISVNSYPFQSSHVLGWFMANLLIAI